MTTADVMAVVLPILDEQARDRAAGALAHQRVDGRARARSSPSRRGGDDTGTKGRFDGDPLRGDNRLAGAPPHVINGILQYDFGPEAFVQMQVDWHPDSTPVDNMNTLFNESFVLVALRANYDMSDRFSVFADLRNIFDQTYASSTLIVDLARRDQAAFLPGDGRAVYFGVRVR